MQPRARAFEGRSVVVLDGLHVVDRIREEKGVKILFVLHERIYDEP